MGGGGRGVLASSEAEPTQPWPGPGPGSDSEWGHCTVRELLSLSGCFHEPYSSILCSSKMLSFKLNIKYYGCKCPTYP